MKILIIGITFLVAFHVGNVEAAEWMPLDEAEDRQLIRTNQSPEEGHIICTSKTRGGGKGIAKDGRRLGFLTKKGCKTIGGGDKVRWFKRENGDLMVLVDDEPAVQDDAQNEGEDYQARYEEARDAAAKAVQQLQDAQEREANLQEQHDAALEGMVSEEDVQGKIDAALEGMVTADDVERREESLQARHDSLISSNIHAALEGMVSEADVQGQIETALVGMVAEEDVDLRVEAALAVREAEADVTPLNCSEGTAVNAAGDACEPTAEYRAAAVEEGRLAGVVEGAASVVIGTHEFKSGVAPDPLFVDACGGPACDQEGQVCYSEWMGEEIRVCRSERWTEVKRVDRCKYMWALEANKAALPWVHNWDGGFDAKGLWECAGEVDEDYGYKIETAGSRILNICEPSVNAEGLYTDPCADGELSKCLAECRYR